MKKQGNEKDSPVLLRSSSPNPPPRSASPSSLSPSLSPAKSSSPVTSKYYPSHNQFTQPAARSLSPKLEKKEEKIERTGSPTPKFIRSASVVQVNINNNNNYNN